MSLFSTLNTANTALSAQQRAIEVTGQNVANVNTDGYSRQRVNMQSVGANAVPAFWSASSQVGSGVNADDVIRIRDSFLEARAQRAHSATASLTVQDTAYSQIEQSFNEPGDNGLAGKMTELWSGWSAIANNPTDPGARSQLLQRAQTLVGGLHSVMGQLEQQWGESQDSVKTLVTDVNATTQSIADLNQSIKQASMANLPTNELADKRDALILHLSGQIGAQAVQMPDGTLNVVVGSSTLVNGNSVVTVALTGAAQAADAGTNPPALTTVPGGSTLAVGGTAAGQLQTMTTIVPGYEKQLNVIAQQLATQVNDQQGQGYDLNGTLGGPLFDNGAGNPLAVTAANISVAITDGSKLAAASLAPTAAGISSDNGNAGRLYQLRLGIPQADGSYADGADSVYRKMIVALGVRATSVSASLQAQDTISTQVDASRESVSGVNIDEEMTNMLQFQHAYAAAGKLVSTVDSMMDALMNMVR